VTEEIELELEVVTLVGGPADGQDVEAPVGYLEIWHCTGPGYARYERSDPIKTLLSWTGDSLANPEAMAEWLLDHGYVGAEDGPIVHVDEPTPRARRQRFVLDAEHGNYEHPHG